MAQKPMLWAEVYARALLTLILMPFAGGVCMALVMFPSVIGAVALVPFMLLLITHQN